MTDIGERSRRQPQMKKRMLWFLAWFGLIAVRMFGLGEVPGGINQDEAMCAVDALALSQYGTDRFGTWLPAHFRAWGYGQMSVLLAYFMVPFIKLFGFDSFGVRLPMVAASVAGAVAVVCFVKRSFGEKTAFATLLFLTVNPWHFMQSRWSLDCNMFPHMFIIAFCLLCLSVLQQDLAKNNGKNLCATSWRGLEMEGSKGGSTLYGAEQKKSILLYLSMFFFALCMYSYGVSFYMVPFFLLAACICLLMGKKVTIKQCLISALIYFGVSFPIYGTMLINFMKWETVSLPFVTMPYFEDSVRSSDILFFCEGPIKQAGMNLQSLFRVVFLQRPDLIWNAIDDFGTMYRFSLPVILLGVILAAQKAAKGKDMGEKLCCRLLLIYWLCSLFVGICINSVNVNRVNIIFYSHIIFAGIGIWFVVGKWKYSMPLVVGCYAVCSMLFFHRYFTVWNDQMEGYFYKDFLEAVEFAGEQQCDRYYITPDTQYEGSVNVTEILTLYALEMDAKYFQGETDVFMGRDIAYRDRFHYVNVPREQLDGLEDAVYVFKTEDIGDYDTDVFGVESFGEYSVARTKYFVSAK